MVIQIANIVSGFVLAAPKLKTFGMKEHVESAEAKLSVYSKTIGLIELVLGVLALIQRLNLAYFPIPAFGSSFPQALIAIAMGLVLGSHFFDKYPDFQKKIAPLKTHQQWLGVLGILIGLFSII